MVDFEDYDRKMQAKLDKCPKCEECGEPIQDELAHMIPKLGLICDRCLESWEVWLD